MPRGVEHPEGKARCAYGVPLAVGVRVVDGPGGEPGGHGQVVGVDIYPAVRFGGQIPHAAHMVKMAVGQKDRVQGQSRFFQPGQEKRRLIARVNEDTVGRSFLPE